MAGNCGDCILDGGARQRAETFDHFHRKHGHTARHASLECTFHKITHSPFRIYYSCALSEGAATATWHSLCTKSPSAILGRFNAFIFPAN